MQPAADINVNATLFQIMDTFSDEEKLRIKSLLIKSPMWMSRLPITTLPILWSQLLKLPSNKISKPGNPALIFVFYPNVANVGGLQIPGVKLSDLKGQEIGRFVISAPSACQALFLLFSIWLFDGRNPNVNIGRVQIWTHTI